MMRVNTAAYRVFAIAPGAGELPRPPTYGLLVGAAGNITMLVGGVSVTLTGVAAGTRVELVPERVTAATATVFGLY
jgi:branched-subunit amino acid permease